MKTLTILKHIAIIVFVISLGACIRDDDNPSSPEIGGGGGGEVLGDSSIGPDVGDSNFYTSKNNSARLDGDVVGPGKADQESLLKVFDVTFTQPSKKLKIEKAYVTKKFENSIYLIIPIRNISDDFLCGVRLKDIVYKDQDGKTLLLDSTSLLYGGIGQSTKGEITNTCLNSNEVGYALGIASPPEDGGKLFSNVSSVEITDSEGSAGTHKRIEERMLPTEYVTLGADRRGFESKFENQGTQSLQPDASPYILLDNKGLPLSWGFLFSKEKDSAGKIIYPTVKPGESASLEVTFLFDGIASTIRPIINFNISGSSRAHSTKTRRALLDPSSFESIDEYSEYLLQQKELEHIEREKRLHE